MNAELDSRQYLLLTLYIPAGDILKDTTNWKKSAEKDSPYDSEY